MGHRLGKAWLALGLALLVTGLPCVGSAANFTVTIMGNGAPLVNAVVSLHPPGQLPSGRPAIKEMDQRDIQFQPHVLAISVGTLVRFPNSDNIRHQVYSFSPAKRFELPLYSGQHASPILFDKPGVVELGCNIHDWMLGYIVVVDTPYYGVTDSNGKLTLQAPAGDYRMEVWHERQRDGLAVQQIRIPGSGSTQRVDIAVDPAPADQKPVDERLRKLQERFRDLKSGH